MRTFRAIVFAVLVLATTPLSAQVLLGPDISGVTVTNVTTTSALVTWTTNEPADSQVQFGADSSYGSSTTLDTALVTLHSVTLTGLNQSTTYHFAVFSRNAAGGLGNSLDATFDTVNPNAPQISGVTASSITGTGAVIAWTTDTLTDSQVFYGLTSSYGSQTTLDATLTSSHSVTLSGLSDGQTYHYKVRSRDVLLNSATSADATFTTPDLPPALSGVTASSITSSGAIITWTTNEAADTQVEYGLTTSYGSTTTLDPIPRTSHSTIIPGLTERTTYHYRVKSRDAAGNLSTSGDYTFKTTIAGFVAGYAFAEPAGSIFASDETINAITGTLGPTGNGPTRTAGKYGKALLFDGVDDSVSFPTSIAEVKLTGSMTISAWIDVTAFTNNESAIVSKRTNGDIGYQLDVSMESGQREIGFRLTNGSAQAVVRYGATTLQPNIWYHIAGVYDAAAQTMNVYLNGVLDNGTLTGTVTSSQQDSAGKLAFGKRIGVTGYEYAGLIDDIRIYNLPLTQDKIQLDMNVGLGGEADISAPLISTVSVTNITTNTATITWSTNEWANSQLLYGPTSSYGFATTLDTTQSYSHTVNLTGLSNSSIYHFAVVSKDPAGNQAQSTDGTFTTVNPSAPVISGITVSNLTGTSAVINWTTDLPSDSQVEFGFTTNYTEETELNTTLTTSHSATLRPLSDGRTYHYRVLSRTSSGHLATGNDATFSTPDISPPVIIELTLSAISTNGATITWTTTEPADSQVKYGPTTTYGSTTPLNNTLETAHSLTLTGLANSTTYHFAVFSKDAAGNTGASSDATFSTVNPNAPHITGVTVASIAETSAVITWTTDAPANSLVEFGPTTSYGSTTTLDSALGLSHTVTVSGLTSKRLYHYRVKSVDAFGNTATSGDATFITSTTLWSGILATDRATDWSAVGAVIPSDRVQCGPAIAAYNGSADVINDAIFTCPPGHYVQLGPGTFNLSTGVELTQSNVTLRGSGSASTTLNIAGITGTSCHLGQAHVMQMCTNGGTNIGVDTPEHTATWTAGYSKGTTTVTINNSTGLAVGSTIWFDQLDETSDGYPSAGDVYTCDVVALNCGNNGTGESYARPGRGLTEGHVVVSCSPSCNSGNTTDVTISPGIIFPTFRAGKSPGAWWGNSETILNNAGLENLTVKIGAASGLFIINCTGCWVKGVRFLRVEDTGSNIFHLFLVNTVNSTVQDNYFYGPPTTELVAVYQLAVHETTNSLFQNNIFHSASSSIVGNAPFYGNVFSYNYVDAGLGASIILHGLGGMNLYEGNNIANFSGDTIHGPHAFETLFRNHHDGRAHNPSGTETQAGVALYSNNRFFNIIGNVFGDTHWTRYQSLQAHDHDAIYEFGWQGTGSGVSVTNDFNVARTAMRWGNYDSVNDAVRFEASEIPSGIPNFPNAIPASQALPASFYLPARPSWWITPFGTSPWAAIGPDVTGGPLSNSGGHAYKIPARLCFENTTVDPAYPSTSPRIKAFDASACYGIGPDATPPTIIGLSVVSTTTTAAVITWTTNEPADSQVMYGPTSGYGSTTPVNTTLATSHVVTVTGLAGNTTYHFSVLSKDASGNLATSTDSAFITADPNAPQISGVTLTSVSATSAVITWTTDAPADSQLSFGLTAAYGSLTALNTTLTTFHTVTVDGVSEGTTYHYRVLSKDEAGNLAVSNDAIFTTTDVSPPQISGVAASAITSAKATIIWTTNEAGNSQVEYGLTSAYGSITSLDTTLGTSHNLVITGLGPSLTYHYRVRSQDASGNTSTSGDLSFLTTSGPVAEYAFAEGGGFSTADTSGNGISGILANGALWGTGKNGNAIQFDGINDSVSLGNPSPLKLTGSMTISAWINSRIFPVDDAAIVSKRLSGEIGYQLDTTLDQGPRTIGFKLTSSSGSEIARYGTTTLRTNSWYHITGVYDAVAQTMDVYLNGVLDNGGLLGTVGTSQRDSADDVNIGRRPGFEFAGTIDDVRIYNRALTQAEILSDMHTPLGSEVDSTAPALSAVNATNLTASSATITWLTNELADGQIEYGISTVYGASTTLNTSVSLSHTASISGLVDQTTYHYRVKSKDESGNLAISTDSIFTTLDVTAPDISSIMAINVTSNSATITWLTNEATDSQVEYGSAIAYADGTTFAPGPATLHSMTLTGLSDMTLYHFRVKSRDGSGNVTTSGDFTFTTLDGTAPTISGVTPINISATAATITWTTNEAADREVQYGLTTGYGLTATLPELSTTHAISLGGLTDLKTYHYRVKSKDAAGNLAISDDETFTTLDGTAPILSDVSVSTIAATSATINWTTNEAADSQVEYGETSTYGSATTLNSSLSLSHTATLSGLRDQTLYYYRVKSKDGAGNLDTSLGATFTTLDGTPPSISGVSVTSLTATAATIQWTTNESAKSQVEYGPTTEYGFFTALNPALETSHSVNLTALTDLKTYHFKVISQDASGNTAVSSDAMFTTLDGTAPVLSGITVTSLTATTATISWTTSEPASTQVEFGTTNAHGSASVLNTALVSTHTVILSGLEDQKLYHFSVESADATGNLAVSPDATFTTLDGTAPVISNVTVTNRSVNSATINWTTNESTTGQVEYGANDAYGLLSALNSTLQMAHTITLNGLAEAATYHFKVLAKDAAENSAASIDASFTTLDATGPEILGVTVTNVTASGATINWTTNEPSDAQVEYGLTNVYGSASPLYGTLSTSHTVQLTGLNGQTTYHYRVKSKDGSENPTAGDDATFMTLDGTPPEISGVTTTSVLATSATIAWITNELADSEVEYGLNSTYGSTTTLNPSKVLSHSVSLTGLSDQTTYHYRVKSKDAALNLAISNDATFTTPDATPPAIFGVSVTSVMATAATITWTTTEAASSQIQYGTSTSYGSTTVLDPALSLNHTVALTGLTHHTTYHYRVLSKDASGNLAAGSDEVFTTLDTTAVISSVSVTSVTAHAATITWTTNELTNTQVAYGTDSGYGSLSPLDTTPRTSHSVTLSALSDQTTYHYQVRSTNDTGNLSTSSDSTFTTPDGTAPTISGVTLVNLTATGVMITWTTNEASDSQVEYGTGTGYGSSTAIDAAHITSHSVSLSGLSDQTLYHYHVKSKDSAGNLATGDDAVFTTLDGTAPTISGVTVSALAGSSATITWTTDEASDTQVEYGLTTDYGSATTLDSVLAMSHSVRLSGLADQTLYHYRVKSKDASTNAAISADHTFTTLDGTPPVISGVTVINLTSSGATITWTTNELADSQLDYGPTTTPYGSTTPLDSTLTLSHSVTVSGLHDQTTVHYRVKSRDSSGNAAAGNDATFTTLDGTPPVISGVSVTNIGGTAATIVWNTNEAADSQVEYGLTDSYEHTSTPGSTLGTEHTVILNALSDRTTYHYHVKSKDSSGNLAMSADATFTTPDTTAPVINGVIAINITATGATITWTTDESADSQIEYGLASDYGSTTALNGTLETTHSVNLPSLNDLTPYHYRVKSRDSSGNLATGNDQTFTTLDGTAPVISGLTAINIASSSATISWTTDEPSDYVLEYGLTTAYGSTATDTNLSASHSVNLTGLTDQSLYHYRVKAKDSSANLAVGSDATFTTLDGTAPVISGFTVISLTSSAATIVWTTNELATSQVEFGPSLDYGSTTVLDTTPGTSHTVHLTGLADQSLYHFRVKSKDTAENLTTGSDDTFTTPDGTAPTVSGVTATSVSATAATITWSTSEPANSQVEFGTSTAYGSITALNAALATSHTMTLSGLASETTYHYRVKSADSTGNMATSADMTFTSSALPAPVISPLTATPPGLNLGAAPYFGGDFPLVVKGQNFVAGAVVSAGDSMLTATFVDSTELRVQVPSNLLSAPGMQDVKVVNPDGHASNVVTLRVVERGDINGNRSITIGDALACALTMGGITKPPLAPTVGDLNLSGTINIGDCLTGALFAGRVNANFNVPKVTGVTPAVALPGGQLTISGTGLAFDSIGDYTEVLFTTAGNGTVRVVPSSSAFGVSLTVTVPDNAVSGPIQVYRVDTPLGGNEFPLNVSGSTASLALTAVDPFFGVAGGSSITLTGMGFDADPANNIVRFAAPGGSVLGTVTAVGSGQSSLTVTVPSGAICGPVTVTTAGQTSNARTLAVAGSLCDLQLTDIWGGGAPGDTIVIEGAGFDVVTAANNIVTFTAVGGGTVIAPVLATGGTQLHVRIPTTAVEGPVSVQVGSAISNSISFTPSPHNQ